MYSGQPMQSWKKITVKYYHTNPSSNANLKDHDNKDACVKKLDVLYKVTKPQRAKIRPSSSHKHKCQKAEISRTSVYCALWDPKKRIPIESVIIGWR